MSEMDGLLSWKIYLAAQGRSPLASGEQVIWVLIDSMYISGSTKVPSTTNQTTRPEEGRRETPNSKRVGFGPVQSLVVMGGLDACREGCEHHLSKNEMKDAECDMIGLTTP